jgi:phage gp36-like protein
MSWTAITATDLQTRLTGGELTALRTAALSSGQTDPLPDILSRAIDECRGYLAARPGGSMGEAGTLPVQIHGAALDIARYRLCTRLSLGKLGETFLPEARYNEYKDALALLRDVQAGKCIVEAPDTLTTENIPASITPSIKLPTGRMTLY